MHGMLIDCATFAEVVGITARSASRALAQCASGGVWHGAKLDVQLVHGSGGASGTRYLVSAARIPAERLVKPLEIAVKESSKAVSARGVGLADRSSEKATQRIFMLRGALQHPKKSKERAAALKAASEQFDVSISTLKRWLALYEAKGRSALIDAPRSDRGVKRNDLPRRWEKGVSFDDATRTTISGELIQFAKDAFANGASFGKVVRIGSHKLAEMTRKAGFDPGEPELVALCKLSNAWAQRYSHFRAVDTYRRDYKTFTDKHLPRALRTINGLRPMQELEGDVHPVDLSFITSQKETIRIRMIGWLDRGTRRLFAHFVLLGRGEGDICQSHIVASFHELTQSPLWGVPDAIILDNGSEYKALPLFEEAMALSAQRGFIGRIVTCRPYSAQSKMIEGVFGAFEAGYVRYLPGYIGGDRTKKKTEGKGKPVAPFSGTAQPALGFRFHLRFQLVGHGLRRLRHRRLRPAHCRMEGVDINEHPVCT